MWINYCFLHYLHTMTNQGLVMTAELHHIIVASIMTASRVAFITINFIYCTACHKYLYSRFAVRLNNQAFKVLVKLIFVSFSNKISLYSIKLR
jgi:hypothetical protein